MTKKLEMTIESCKECLYRSAFYSDNMKLNSTCSKNMFNVIENTDVIPEWCLLPEVE